VNTNGRVRLIGGGIAVYILDSIRFFS